MSRQYEDQHDGYRELFGEFQERRFRAQSDPELLTRLREADEGVSLISEAECQSPELDSSATSSLEASRWEWCAGGPPRVTPMTPPSPKHSTNRLWRTVQHLYGRVRRR